MWVYKSKQLVYGFNDKHVYKQILQ